MPILTILAFALSLAAPGGPAVAGDALRAAITAALSERLGTVRSVEIEIVSGTVATTEIVAAEPAPGSRLGQPVRFMVTPRSGRPFQIVARVSVVAGHAVAVAAIDRDAEVTASDVEWKEAPVVGQLLQPLPRLTEVVGSVARRSIAPGEVLTSTVIAKPLAVRAGEEVDLTFRSGAIEVRGIARAVSSGSVGDVIRVTTPGSRDIRQARITAPATVEIVR